MWAGCGVSFGHMTCATRARWARARSKRFSPCWRRAIRFRPRRRIRRWRRCCFCTVHIRLIIKRRSVSDGNGSESSPQVTDSSAVIDRRVEPEVSTTLSALHDGAADGPAIDPWLAASSGSNRDAAGLAAACAGLRRRLWRVQR